MYVSREGNYLVVVGARFLLGGGLSAARTTARARLLHTANTTLLS